MTALLRLFLITAALATAASPAMSDKFEKISRWGDTDLRLLVFEAKELEALRTEGAVLIDITFMAPAGVPQERIDALRFKQPAGKTVAEHLRAIEEAMRFTFQDHYRVQLVAYNQMRVVEISKLAEELAGLKTRPGDAIILRRGRII